MDDQDFDLDTVAFVLQDVNLSKISASLIQKGVLSDRSIHEYLNKFECDNVEWFKPFLLEVFQQGRSIMQRFLTILKDAGYGTTAEDLHRQLKIPPGDGDISPPLNLHSFSGITLNDDVVSPGPITFIDDAQPDGLRLSCCAAQDDDEKDSAEETFMPVTNVTVKAGTEFYSPQNDRIYKMGSKPKGYALVIVNQNFDNGIYEFRDGAGKDQQNLIALFSGLGYTVDDHFNKSSHEMRHILRKFADLPAHASVDSCIVAISSHGENSRIVGTDNEYIFMEDVLDMFNNEKCPKLKGKPKLFFIQACRGDKFDAGISNNNVADGKLKSLPNKFLLQPQQRSPSWTDMLIAHSTIPEHVALRNEKHGSWFIIAVTRVFMQHAWNTPISTLFSLVVEEMENYQTSTGDKQVPEIIHRGWKKDLFFNPGLYQPL